MGFGSKQIDRIVDETGITTSTNVMLTRISRLGQGQRLDRCFVHHIRARRDCTQSFHNNRARLYLEIWEQNYCFLTSGIIAHALFLTNDMSTGNALSRGLRFPFRWTRVTRALGTRLDGG